MYLGASCQLSPILYSAKISEADPSFLPVRRTQTGLVKYIPRNPAVKSSSTEIWKLKSNLLTTWGSGHVNLKRLNPHSKGEFNGRIPLEGAGPCTHLTPGVFLGVLVIAPKHWIPACHRLSYVMLFVCSNITAWGSQSNSHKIALAGRSNTEQGTAELRRGHFDIRHSVVQKKYLQNR